MERLLEIRDGLLRGVGRLPSERRAVEGAEGRVLAEAALARRAAPPYACSAMDGYAVRATEAAAGGNLPVGQQVFARRPPAPARAGPGGPHLHRRRAARGRRRGDPGGGWRRSGTGGWPSGGRCARGRTCATPGRTCWPAAWRSRPAAALGPRPARAPGRGRDRGGRGGAAAAGGDPLDRRRGGGRADARLERRGAGGAVPRRRRGGGAGRRAATGSRRSPRPSRRRPRGPTWC